MSRSRWSALLLVALLALLTVGRAHGGDLARRRMRASRENRVEGIGRRGLPESDVDFDTLDKCQELKGGKYDECVEEWLAENPPPTPAPVVMLTESLPPMIADIMGFTSPSSIASSESIASDSIAVDDSGNSSTSDFATVDEADHDSAAENDVTGNDPGAAISDGVSEAASKSDKGDTKFNNVESVHVDDVVYVNIGKYDMSLTIYSSPDMLNGFANNEEYHSFARQYELAATTDHLRNVYEELFKKKVIAIKINFAPGGATEMSQGTVLHATFDGTVAFDDNSEPELQSETFFAFRGEQKQIFLQMFHGFYYEAMAMPSDTHEAADDIITTMYDVVVKKSSSANSVGVIMHESSSSDSTTEDNNTALIVLTIMSVAVTVITLAGIAVFIRRSLRPVPESKLILKHAVFDDGSKVEKVVDDEEGQNHHDGMEVLSDLDESSTADTDGKSFEGTSMQSSISSRERRNFNPPFPVEFSSSSLNSTEDKFMRLNSDFLSALNDNGSTWSFTDIGGDNKSTSSPEGGSSIASESCGTSLGGASDLFRNVMMYDEMVISKEKVLGMTSIFQGDVSGMNVEHCGDGGSFIGEIHDGSSSSLGDVNDLEYDNGSDGGSFIEEILSRDDAM